MSAAMLFIQLLIVNLILGSIFVYLFIKFLELLMIEIVLALTKLRNAYNRKTRKSIAAFNETCPVCIAQCDHPVVIVGCRHQFCQDCFVNLWETAFNRNPTELLTCCFCRNPVIKIVPGECTYKINNNVCYKCNAGFELANFYNMVIGLIIIVIANEKRGRENEDDEEIEEEEVKEEYVVNNLNILIVLGTCIVFFLMVLGFP
ncbi:hypothetical protein B9Z55_026465 [Caenorhabditis nigoni]|nr:hypothetical protein B9Z55_026465 [Caenorhabditis nigoni]